jgi:hypothetical protein
MEYQIIYVTGGSVPDGGGQPAPAPTLIDGGEF